LRQIGGSTSAAAPGRGNRYGVGTRGGNRSASGNRRRTGDVRNEQRSTKH
jgi:hypothetical protein